MAWKRSGASTSRSRMNFHTCQSATKSFAQPRDTALVRTVVHLEVAFSKCHTGVYKNSLGWKQSGGHLVHFALNFRQKLPGSLVAFQQLHLRGARKRCQSAAAAAAEKGRLATEAVRRTLLRGFKVLRIRRHPSQHPLGVLVKLPFQGS